MIDELVDIVDKNDKVIGNCFKKEAHAKGLLHRCVIAEIIDSQDRWTLVKQAGDRQDAGQYVSPVGGHVTSGEDIEDALKREAKEEMGLENFKFKLVGKAIFLRTVIGRKENHLFIVYKIYTNQQPTLNHESVSFQKFTVREWKKIICDTPLLFGDAWWFVVKNFFPEFL